VTVICDCVGNFCWDTGAEDWHCNGGKIAGADAGWFGIDDEENRLDGEPEFEDKSKDAPAGVNLGISGTVLLDDDELLVVEEVADACTNGFDPELVLSREGTRTCELDDNN
jgi:hypothetical protein